ncbi:MAG TPA: hypothetical protein VHD32_02850 [Candidatus Didemnitutus sp.]|nr:hypothetical protein [Candidatus Didemnitutus sp.]
MSIGTLLTLRTRVELPERLSGAVGLGEHSAGELLVPGLPRLTALYHIETLADEMNSRDGSSPGFWMEDKKLKAGDVIGRAIDNEGTLYAFLSAHA